MILMRDDSNIEAVDNGGLNNKVLIVDDSAVNRMLLTRTLSQAGYSTCEANDGASALDIIKTFEPDLILLDIMMPGMDGFEVCSKIKKEEETKDIPVIFLSAKTETEDKIKGFEIGGADYITKPFDRGEVLARVRSQLKIRNLTQELMRANHELVEKQRRLDEDLRAAAGIQQSLLPHQSPYLENLKVAWRFRPCQLIGGDIFNVSFLDENHVAAYILDVSGHGVPSALVSATVHQVLQPQSGVLVKDLGAGGAREIVRPSEVLARLDREYPIERFDKYFTIFYMVVDVKEGVLHYSNAAHPYPVLVRCNGDLELLDVGGTIIGMDGVLPFENGRKQLGPKDKIILYTDGIVECENSSGELFGERRLHDKLRLLKGEPIGRTLDAVFDTVLSFSGSSELTDDVSILGIEFIGK